MARPSPSRTRRQPPGVNRQRVWSLVRDRLAEGRPPTVREVQQALGFRAVQTARQHLEALVTEGRLLVDRGRSRGYRLPGPGGAPPAWVPLLGRVQAGALTGAVEDLEGYIPVQARTGAEDLFALRVRGDSMTGAGILHGDLVIVRKQAKASDRDIVVARVGDDATVKRLRIRRGRVELWPENPAFEPIALVPADDPSAGDEGIAILGKVIEVRRRLAETGGHPVDGATVDAGGSARRPVPPPGPPPRTKG